MRQGNAQTCFVCVCEKALTPHPLHYFSALIQNNKKTMIVLFAGTRRHDSRKQWSSPRQKRSLLRADFHFTSWMSWAPFSANHSSTSDCRLTVTFHLSCLFQKDGWSQCQREVREVDGQVVPALRRVPTQSVCEWAVVERWTANAPQFLSSAPGDLYRPKSLQAYTQLGSEICRQGSVLSPNKGKSELDRDCD